MYLENASMMPGVILLLMEAKKQFWGKNAQPRIVYTVLILRKITINGLGPPKSNPFLLRNVYHQSKLML